MKKEKIFIAGPPCSGKSTTGQILASRLGLPFHDLDNLIEKASSLKISEIFNFFGEKEFRRLESEALYSQLLSPGRFVLALGGGCLIDKSNFLAINRSGIIVTLTASDEILLNRFRQQQKKNRPLAMSGIALKELLRKRKEHYNSLPNRINTSNISPEQTALEIIKLEVFNLPAD